MNNKLAGKGASSDAKASAADDPDKLLEELVLGNYDPKAEQFKAHQQLANKQSEYGQNNWEFVNKNSGYN